MHSCPHRCPVRYKGIPLMPMTSVRIKKFIEQGKGRIRYDRKLKLHWFQLFNEPSGFETQPITIGIDPGSCFDGISLVSKNNHHCNYELVQRRKSGHTSIKTLKERQASNRRVRRSRLRHRPIRFDHRTAKKLAPTIKANIDFRKWLITGLLKYYPITDAVVEDVAFKHTKKDKGKSFSHVEQGKTELYDFIKSLNITLTLYKGYNTAKLRKNSFANDPKVAAKGLKVFNAHCIDSFVLACNKTHVVDQETGEILMDEPKIAYRRFMNKKVIFIEKIFRVRRCLTRTRRLINDKKQHFRYEKGGEKVFFTKISKNKNICRVKKEGNHSNHPKEWIVINNGYAACFKRATARYGGTTINGKTSFKNNEWVNRCISGNVGEL